MSSHEDLPRRLAIPLAPGPAPASEATRHKSHEGLIPSLHDISHAQLYRVVLKYKDKIKEKVLENRNKCDFLATSAEVSIHPLVPFSSNTKLIRRTSSVSPSLLTMKALAGGCRRGLRICPANESTSFDFGSFEPCV
jgi:hypothetical protein